MNNKLKTIAVALAFTCFSSCGGGAGGDSIVNFESDSGESEIVLPDYDAKKDEYTFLTSAFFSPVVTEESMKEYTDCGFDVMWINGNNVGYGDDQRIRNALALAEKQNVKCVIDATISRSEGLTLSMICNDYGYQNYKSLWAVNAYDEPVTRQGDWGETAGIAEIAKYIPKFQQIYGKEMPFFVNCNPFPCQPIIPDYNAYIKEDINEIVSKTDPSSQRWLSCDCYCLIYNPYYDTYYLRSTWLYNLQLFAEAKKNYPELDINTNFFILSTPHTTRNVEGYKRSVSYNELRLQVYSLIAFGYDMASYFTYATPPSAGGETFYDALLDADGNKTERWYAAQKLNNEVHAFDHVFMQFNYKGAYGVTGTVDNHSNESFDYLNMLSLDDLGELKSVTATADTLIGIGEDENGNSGYTIVNYNDPYYENNDTVTMKFGRATKAIVYIGGEKQIKDLNNHELTLELGIGEGVFVIPY